MGHWLNSLTWLDHLIILVMFAISGYSSHLTMRGLRILVKKQKNPYAPEFRTSPFAFFALAIPYTILLYKIFGAVLTELIQTIF